MPARGIPAESNVKALRMKEMITNNKTSTWLLNTFSPSVPQEMYREQCGEYAFQYQV